jgi:hypothetical protein
MSIEEKVKQLENNWNTLYKFLENTDRLTDNTAVMLLDLMDNIKNGVVK